MFEIYEPPPQTSHGPKILAFSVAGLLLSLGLCGAGAALDESSFAIFFIGTGSIVLVASLLAFIVGIIWLVLDMANRNHRA